MAGQWSITNTGAVSATATAAVSAGTVGGLAIRCRSYQASVGISVANITGTLVVRDGATGAGTILDQLTVNSNQPYVSPIVDLRATSGILTVEFTGGVTNSVLSVNAQGDFVQTGKAYGDG